MKCHQSAEELELNYAEAYSGVRHSLKYDWKRHRVRISYHEISDANRHHDRIASCMYSKRRAMHHPVRPLVSLHPPVWSNGLDPSNECVEQQILPVSPIWRSLRASGDPIGMVRLSLHQNRWHSLMTLKSYKVPAKLFSRTLPHMHAACTQSMKLGDSDLLSHIMNPFTYTICPVQSRVVMLFNIKRTGVQVR